jgi:KAP-like P-loop domain-containing protein
MAMGLTDGPADQDHLGIESYYVGLADFIEGCPTPMTVALQGDWGTGKTSAMKMVQDLLEQGSRTTKIVEFNTWQYSQFDLGEQLVFTLLQAILDKVAPPEDVEASGELLRKVARISNVVGAAAGAFARTIVSSAGGHLGQATVASVDGALDAVRDGAPQIDRSAKLVDVRAEFAKIVQDHVNVNGAVPGRVVVFIDDLDRLPPTRAIEVMEALKTLFDCPGCIFVLAIDFDVVKRGVRLKYGNEMDDAKARAYFDKFIQVPFQMPVAEYQISSLLRSSLLELGLANNDSTPFEQLTKLSVGANPRAVKRLLNAFTLLTRVAKARSETDTAQQDRQTFALLALEAAYPGFHAEVRSAVGTAELHDLLSSAAGAPDPHGDMRDPAAWGIDVDRVADFRQFVALLPEVLGAEEDVAKALDRTSLTTVGGRTATALTLTDPAQKAARAAASGIGPAQLQQARRLEDLLEQEVARRGAGFESALRSKPDWWHWYALSPDGTRSKSWGQLTFAAGGRIRLYFGSPGWPADRRGPVEGRLRDLATRQGWRLETSDKGTYFRLHEIGADDDITELAPLLADCALLALS